ncbi:LysE family translocator [uncultured Nonlabens sp.]|uniref:LysE family translocator n=1 Tax=uncultured Nonlabens sp. TaxID=859306 RepID=UPI002630FB43|nr:LysE family translocator [uncultured Nonlabens sp.]
MIETLISFALATLLLALSPGPDNIFVLTQSVARGSKYGIAIASGLITGCIVHTSVVALGFAVIIRDNQWLLYSIKIAGAIYLLYLAFKIYKSDASIEFGYSETSSQSLWKLYKVGITMNLLNPKVTLFFLALLPQFVITNSYPDWIQIYILGSVFMLVSLFTFYTIALLAGKAASFIKTSTWFTLAMKWIQIVVFIGIAIFILVN